MSAEVVDTFAQTDPVEGAAPTGRTTVQVLAGPKALVIGIVCDDPDPSGIVSFSVRRDATLTSEDHIRIVLGPFLDGRSGYVFSVNPNSARYDALINPGGESDNPDWDGIWEAAGKRTATGWATEVWIPIQTLSFNPSLRTAQAASGSIPRRSLTARSWGASLPKPARAAAAATPASSNCW